MFPKALLALVLALSIEALPVPSSIGIPESFPANNISLPEKNNSLPVNNNSLPVNNNSLPVYNSSLLVYNNTLPIDVNDAINRDDPLWPLPNISLPMYNNSLPVYNNSLPVYNNSLPAYNFSITVPPELPGPIDAMEAIKNDDVFRSLYNYSLPVNNNSLPVFNDSLPVFNFSLPASNMTIPENNNISRPMYNFSIPAPQELPISPSVMEEISREYLPRPVSGFQAMMDSSERTGGKFPFGVQNQERQDNPGYKSMDSYAAKGFKCYSGKQIVTVPQYFCSFALRVVKRPSEKFDCDMKYLVKSEPKFGDHENDLAFYEEETDGFQTIRVHCRCYSPLCNAEENFNQCMVDASHQKVYQNFTYNRNFRDLMMCIYKKTRRYPMQKQDGLHLNNAIMTSMENNKMTLPMCYYGNEIVQATKNYCGLVLLIFKKDADKMDCDITSRIVLQTPRLSGARRKFTKDLIILEERVVGFQMITIQCKCYTSLCNTKENLNGCVREALEKNNMYSNVKRTDDIHGLVHCFSNNKKSDDGARMFSEESFRSIDDSAFASMKNGNGVADDASSSVEPMREHADEWRAETARDSNIADDDSAKTSEDTNNM